MKTLTQVEPRIDVTTLSGDSQNLYIINQPGSYYLTKNINGVANTNGISIQADNVTVDLNGFALIGPIGSGTGIIVVNNHSAITIRNGALLNWFNGIQAGTANDSVISHIRAINNGPNFGIAIGLRGLISDCRAQANRIGLNADNDSSIIRCTAQGNSSFGIFGNPGTVISHCTAQGNGGVGIEAVDACVISDCTARGTVLVQGFGDGILAGNNCRVTNCVATGNARYGISAGFPASLNGCVADINASVGIFTQSNATLIGCAANSNTGGGIQVTDSCTINMCAAGLNHGFGISVNNASKISHCTANGNGITSGDGIVMVSANSITDCVANSNGSGASAAGVHVTGFGNRIEGNEVRDNNANSSRGIKIDVATGHNIIIRNTAGNNGLNYDIASGNGLGPIISADAGNVGNAANSPLANIQD